MSKVKGYPLIDCFRIIAAILVVTIHTSPLDTISPTLDFYLTRGLGRIAVPFFFITTAYFYFLQNLAVFSDQVAPSLTPA